MKYKLSLLLALITSYVSAQAVSTYPEETTPAGADLLYLVKTPGGASTSRKATVTNITKGLAPASASVQGVVTTGTQTFAGAKTFTHSVNIPTYAPNSSTLRFGSGGTVLDQYLFGTEFYIADLGGTGTTITGSGFKVLPVSSSVVGQIIKLAPTPTANAFEINSSAGSGGDKFKIAASGQTSIFTTTAGSILSTSNTATSGTNYGIITEASGVGATKNIGITGYASGATSNSSIVIPLDAPAIGANNYAIESLSTAKSLFSGSVSIGNGTPIIQVLSATGTLDFADTVTGTVTDLNVTVTGAAVGDVVNLGVPHGVMTTTGIFFGWVSATDTVTVRFSHNAVGSENPPSGDFRVMVTKF